MRPLTAWLTILGSLVLGVVAGNLFIRGAAPVLELAGPCLLINEAQKAGHLPTAKQAELVGKLAQSKDLDAKGKAIAGRLVSECPNLNALVKGAAK